jgi:hypothetical protein
MTPIPRLLGQHGIIQLWRSFYYYRYYYCYYYYCYCYYCYYY